MQFTSFPYRTAFVVNPHAGGGRGQKTWNKIESFLRKKKVEYEVYFAGINGEDATQAAALASGNGAEMIVAIGGDGTVKEVVNGMDTEKNILGLISGGTANGFRRSLKIPHNVIASLKGLFHWPVINMDLGKVNDKYFVNSVGLGFDAQVAKTATNPNNWLKGYPAFIVACLKHLNFAPRTISYQIDGGPVKKQDTVLTLAANGCFYGGQLCVAPQAEIDDGILDFEYVEPVNKVWYLGMLGLALLRSHLWLKGFHVDKAKKIFIDCKDDTMPVQIDGETRDEMKFPLEISIFHKALKVVSPLNLKLSEKHLWLQRLRNISSKFAGLASFR